MDADAPRQGVKVARKNTYIPTQAVAEYLASCLEPRLDGIIFHSAQTAGQGRNVVLFNHAAGLEPYTLPAGAEVKIHTGWSSEDDYDDSIFVSEITPVKEIAETVSGTASVPDFAAILAATSSEMAHEENIHLSYIEPTLKLNVESIEVCRVKAVSYDKVPRGVTRLRRPANSKFSF